MSEDTLALSRLQAVRVAALKRLFERKANSPRLFRHQIYARIAEREPEAWALCGTLEQRRVAITDPSSNQSGSRPAIVIVHAWKVAMKEAFEGFEFGDRVCGSKNQSAKPNGVWTTDIGILA